MHVDTICMKLSIMYFMGLPVKISINDVFVSVQEDCFYLRKQCRPR